MRSRLFTGGTRRAIELRDRICTHPYCYEPAESCQVDHIETYAEGGPTTQENGRLLCGFHNRLRNQHERPTSASGRRRPRPEGAAGAPGAPVGRCGPAQSKPEVIRRFGAPGTGCTPAHHDTGQRVKQFRCLPRADLMGDDPTKFTQYVRPGRILYLTR